MSAISTANLKLVAEYIWRIKQLKSHIFPSDAGGDQSGAKNES